MRKFLNFSLIFVSVVIVFFIVSPYLFKYMPYSQKTLQKDVDYLISQLKIHYVEDFQSDYIKIYKRMNRYEFYVFLLKRFSSLPGVYFFLPISAKTTNVLPFELRYVNGKYIIINSQCELKNDVELLAVDGVKIKEYFSRFGNGEKQFFARYIFPYLGDILRKKRLKIDIPGENLDISVIELEKFIPLPAIKVVYGEDIAEIFIYSFDFSKGNFYKYIADLEHIAASSVKKVIFDLNYAYEITNDLSGLYTISSFIFEDEIFLFDIAIFKYGNKRYEYKNFGKITPNEVNFKDKQVYFLGSVSDPIGKVLVDRTVLYANFKIVELPWTKIKVFIPTAKYMKVK
ncbi:MULTISPECIES: hypothetical protein [unclassified Thermosipho (in: thermotogales)]|uniref:hypothetical protein n=1 Tax=unclassified Thermosipho (in: thermotogales) TaxID=2676525 RepID=UPI000987149B|nr:MULTISPECIES: hypothetical protein [unclassified Thermosipho (in: thermotogales)]MBT1248407.1 hypothetical protein [Thermosipho sp. 1244]OOC47535.1 hypothetical protein XO09_00850 [Thermosipho sp. 1223]